MSDKKELDDVLDIDGTNGAKSEHEDQDINYSDDGLTDEERKQDEERQALELDEFDIEDEEVSTAMPMKTKLMLGGLTVVGVGLVGLAGAQKFGLIGGESAPTPVPVQSVQPAPVPDTSSQQVSIPAPVVDAPTEPVSIPQPAVNDLALEKNQERPLEIPKFGEQKADSDNADKFDDKVEGVKRPQAELSNLGLANTEKPTDLSSNSEAASKVIEKITLDEETKQSVSELEDSVEDLEQDSQNLEKRLVKVEKRINKQLSGGVNKLSQETIAQLSGDFSELEKQFTQMSKMNSRLSNKEKEALIDGRSRLSGFKVVNTTGDGSMSIVVTPSKRVQVFFEGESFRSRFGSTLRIDEIKDSGNLLLVGSKYFIDETYVAPPKPKAKPKPKPAPKKVVKPKKAEEKVKLQEDRLESKNFKHQKVNGKKKAIGWTVNGAYEDGFLVQMPTGKWDTVRTGTMLEGLGMVEGVDKDGNLVVGDYIIEEVQD